MAYDENFELNRSNDQKSYLEKVLKAALEWVFALYISDLSLEFIDGKIVLYLAYGVFLTVVLLLLRKSIVTIV